jgi:hypothetical protein
MAILLVILLVAGALVIALLNGTDDSSSNATLGMTVAVIVVMAGIGAIIVKLMIDDYQAARLRSGRPRLKFSRKLVMPVARRAGIVLVALLAVIGVYRAWRHWPTLDPVTRVAAPPNPPIPAATHSEPLAEVTPAPIFDADMAREALRQRLEAWRAAWSERRIDDYLACYGPNFQPPEGLTRAAWVKQRRERIANARDLNIRVDNMEFQVLTPTTATIAFRQRYKSSTVSEVTRKTLIFETREGRWHIIRELSQP